MKRKIIRPLAYILCGIMLLLSIPNRAFAETKSATTTIKFTFVGDVMLADYKGQRTKNGFYDVYDEKGEDWFFDKVKSYFENDDFTVINMENVFTDNKNLNPCYKDENPGYWYKSETKYASPLGKASIEVADMNNNHAGDYGKSGFNDTRTTLESYDIANGSFGRPIYLEKDDVKITIICGGLWSTSQGNQLAEFCKKERPNCDILIVYFHGGTMMVHKPDDFKINGAHKAIDAGADLVIGAHPHCLQPMETYKGKTIVYSLGNFCYGGSKKPENRTVIYQHEFTLDDKQIISEASDVIPCYVYTGESNNFQPAPIEDEAERNAVLEFMKGNTNSPFVGASNSHKCTYEIELIDPKTMYIAKTVNERNIPDKSGTLIATHRTIGEEIIITGIVKNNTYNNMDYVQISNGNFLPVNWLKDKR